MAQSGYTPIQLYRTTTAAAVPLTANLAPGELAINIANGDMALFAENASGTVTRLMNNPAGLKYPTADGTAGQVVQTNGSGVLSFAAAASGTVTSVAATVPSLLSISGSPITSSGTLAITYSGTALPVANGGTSLTTLTANNVILGNGASAPNFVAPSTSGNVLTSNGTTWASTAPAGTGALTLLSTVTASSSATVDVETTFSSTYSTYMLVADSVILSVDGNGLQCRLKLGGAYATSANYAYHTQVSRSNSTAYGALASQVQTYIEIGEAGSNAAGASLSFTMFVRHPASTTLCKQIDWHGGWSRAGSSVELESGVGAGLATTALTGVRFFAPSGTILSGTFRLYGIANS